MLDLPRLIEKEVYYKDFEQLKIDVIDIAKNNLFAVERIYFLSTNNEKHISGNHAHLNQSQLFYTISGAATIKLINPKNEEYLFKLEKKGVYVPCSYWIEVTVEPNSIVLCIASKSYGDLITIHSLDEFLKNNI